MLSREADTLRVAEVWSGQLSAESECTDQQPAAIVNSAQLLLLMDIDWNDGANHILNGFDVNFHCHIRATLLDLE